MINFQNFDNKKLVLIALFGLIVAYLDFTFAIGLQRSAIDRIAGEVVKLKQGIDSFNTEFANMRQIKNSKDKLAKGQLLNSKKLIVQEELPLLMQDISLLANNNTVKIMRLDSSGELKAKEEKPHEAAAPGQRPQAALITMEVVGDYHKLGAFINDLELVKEFMEVEELKIVQNQANYAQQYLSLAVRTYVKK